MNIDKALEILDKVVSDSAKTEFPLGKYSPTKTIMALETVNSWIQAVKDKFNAPLEDEY